MEGSVPGVDRLDCETRSACFSCLWHRPAQGCRLALDVTLATGAPVAAPAAAWADPRVRPLEAVA